MKREEKAPNHRGQPAGRRVLRLCRAGFPGQDGGIPLAAEKRRNDGGHPDGSVRPGQGRLRETGGTVVGSGRHRDALANDPL